MFVMQIARHQMVAGLAAIRCGVVVTAAMREKAARAARLADPALTFGLNYYVVTGADGINLRSDGLTSRMIGMMQAILSRTTRRAEAAFIDDRRDAAQASQQRWLRGKTAAWDEWRDFSRLAPDPDPPERSVEWPALTRLSLARTRLVDIVSARIHAIKPPEGGRPRACRTAGCANPERRPPPETFAAFGTLFASPTVVTKPRAWFPPKYTRMKKCESGGDLHPQLRRHDVRFKRRIDLLTCASHAGLR